MQQSRRNFLGLAAATVIAPTKVFAQSNDCVGTSDRINGSKSVNEIAQGLLDDVTANAPALKDYNNDTLRKIANRVDKLGERRTKNSAKLLERFYKQGEVARVNEMQDTISPPKTYSTDEVKNAVLLDLNTGEGTIDSALNALQIEADNSTTKILKVIDEARLTCDVQPGEPAQPQVQPVEKPQIQSI